MEVVVVERGVEEKRNERKALGDPGQRTRSRSQ